MDTSIAQKLTARVEAAIKTILGNETDEFDAPEFDVVDYVNAHFPDEKSLGGLDAQIAAMELEIKELDGSILETVREQSTAGQVAARDIADAKDSIGDLHSKILEIKAKADASERMVQEICRDIRQLDVAKKHLTNTIMTIARLKTLSSAVDQLKGHAARRSYEEAAPLLEASIQLFAHFTEYKDVPKVSELANAVEKIREELREAISEDFDILIDCAAPDNPSFLTGGDEESGRYKVQKLTDLDLKEGGEGGGGGDAAVGARELSDDNVQTLQASCEVVDALGPTVRKSVIKAFNRKQLKPYGILFRRGSGADLGDGLEGVERRYMWARRALRDIDAKYKRVLPPHWHVLHRLALDFAEATRNDIDRILGQYDPPSSAPADVLLRALMKTLAWEKEMAKLFEKGADGAGGTSKSGRDAGIGAAMFEDGAGGGGADGEAYDESAPLYNSKGELVDPTSAEGIRLKYKRKKEWEERRANEAHRKAERDQKRAWWASLAGMDGGGGGAAAAKRDDEYASLPRFAEPGRGIISSAFEPYMGAYVRFERAQVDGVVASATAEELAAGPAGAVGGAGTGASASSTGVGGAPILRSSTQLFFQARNSMARCSELNKGATLFSLFKEVKEAFALYAAGLEARLPKPLPPAPGNLPGDTYDVPLDDLAKAVNLVDSLCLVVNTAEYCADTLPALGDNVRRLLDDSFKPHVGTLEDAQEVFFSLQAAALKTLSGVVACMLDPPLSRLSKHPWASVTEVGDQSAYVADVGRTLRIVMPRVRSRLGEAPFRNFCDKFARSFMARYQASLFRCKRIGDTGAQQLLLDAQAIRAVLLAAPGAREAALPVGGAGGAGSAGEDDELETLTGGAHGDEPPAPPPPVYAKYIQREMPRVEMLLKIIGSPRERFGDTIKALWPEASLADLTRVMDLKGLAKKEQTDILVYLGLVKPSSAPSLVGGLGLGSLTGGGGAQAGAAGGGAGGAGASGAGISGVNVGSFGASGASGAAGAGGTGSSGGGVNITAAMKDVKLSMKDMGKLFGKGKK